MSAVCKVKTRPPVIDHTAPKTQRCRNNNHPAQIGIAAKIWSGFIICWTAHSSCAARAARLMFNVMTAKFGATTGCRIPAQPQSICCSEWAASVYVCLLHVQEVEEHYINTVACEELTLLTSHRSLISHRGDNVCKYSVNKIQTLREFQIHMSSPDNNIHSPLALV